MVVDQPIPADAIPSSQPDDDDIATYRQPSLACIDDSPPPTKVPNTLLNDKGKVVPESLHYLFQDMNKWKSLNFTTLNLAELEALPEIALAVALDHDISIDTLKGNLLNA